MIIGTIMKDTLHTIGQWLLIPAMLVLLLLIVISIASIGSILAETFTERRKKENIPELILCLHCKSIVEMTEIIKESGLLKKQKLLLIELLKYSNLPSEELSAIAKKLITTEEANYEKILGLTELVARIGPMLGLMGTLIPLGPGILALGQGDTKTLSDSMLVAFDTTISGLFCAAVCFVISKIRRRWYEEYLVSVESLMDCILEEVHRNEEKYTQP